MFYRGEIWMLVANDEYYKIIDNSQQDEYNLVLKASKGDKIALEYIIKKYKNFVKAKAKSYFLIGADKEDIIQEGMIGLYKAIRDFDGNKTNSFKCFADICITRPVSYTHLTLPTIPFECRSRWSPYH